MGGDVLRDVFSRGAGKTSGVNKRSAVRKQNREG